MGYIWLRADLVDAVDALELPPNYLKPIVNLCCIASRCPVRGTISMGDEELAKALGMEERDMLEFIARCDEEGIVEVGSEAGIVIIAPWVSFEENAPEE